MSEVRRSTRIRTKSYQEKLSEGNGEESAVGIQNDDTTTIHDPMSEDEESDDGSDDGDDADEDYQEPSQLKKRQAQPKSAHAKSSKRAKNGSGGRALTPATMNPKKDKELYDQIVKEFEPTEIFEALATSEDLSIDELLRNWLETYTTNRDQFLQEFINLLLCCCGAVTRVESHDVHSNESSNETIGEVQIMFQNQKIHEFHLLISKNHKKKSKFQHLYGNFVEFMKKLMDIANELDLLYSESGDEDGQISTSALSLDLLTWLSSLSVCKLRALRYVSTLTLYLFQDFLTEHVVDLERNYLSKLSKQLATEEKKKRPNAKTIEKLESAIEEIESSKMVIQSIIDNIIKICFVHRFKDVDESLRCTSMIHLSRWIQNYPEYFLKVTFLKYFGWLLSDSSFEVRLEVLKALPHFIGKNHNKHVDNSAIRQFFERFKERVVEIALKDENLDVRIGAVNVLVEVVPLGYMEDEECLEITRLIFDENEAKIGSHSKNSRLLASAAKFFSRVVDERCQEFTKIHEMIDEKIYGVDASSLVKIGVFSGLLNESLHSKAQNESDLRQKPKIDIIFQASEFLYPYFGSLLHELCQILVYDGEYDHPFLQQKDSEDTQRVTDMNIEVLLPNEAIGIELYTKILQGLCNGGIHTKGQPRHKVADAILPHFNNLLTQLPLHVSHVLPAVLGIFRLFSFEDWIHTGYEKDLVNIVKKIVRAFMESGLDYRRTNERADAFSKTIEFIRKMELSELDALWMNLIVHVKIQLNKFLDENMRLSDEKSSVDENTYTLYSMFINKLVLVGKSYPVEFDNQLLEKFLEHHVARIPHRLEDYNSETIETMNFQILTLLITWQLQNWTDALEKATSTHIPKVPVPGLDGIANIVKVMSSVCVELNEKTDISSRFLLSWSLANSFIDTIVSLKVFKLRLPEAAEQWNGALEEILAQIRKKDIEPLFLQVFLFMESLFAKNIGIQLDRSPEEDVNLNDINEDVFGSDNERQFLLFALKLKGLMKLELLSAEIISRIALNTEKLGPLYESIMNDTIFEHELKPEKSSESHPTQKASHREGSDDDHAQMNEMYSDIDMLQNDPIEGSDV